MRGCARLTRAERLLGTGLWIPECVIEFLQGRAARLGRHNRIIAYLDMMTKEAGVQDEINKYRAMRTRFGDRDYATLIRGAG